MEVDLSSIIISLVVFSFFIIPIAYDQWKNKDKNKNQEKEKQKK